MKCKNSSKYFNSCFSYLDDLDFASTFVKKIKESKSKSFLIFVLCTSTTQKQLKNEFQTAFPPVSKTSVQTDVTKSYEKQKCF